MASFLRRQRDALIKEQPSSQDVLPSGATPKSLHLLLIELANDEQVLKGFNRIDDKIAHKRDVLVPKYKQAVDEYLTSGERFDNPLFAIMIVWLFDTDDLTTAISWCDKAIEHKLDTPARFKRDFATFCADEVLKWCERMAATGHSIEPYFSQTFQKVREVWRLNEQLTAKWYKFAGLLLLRDHDGKPRASSVGDIHTLELAKALLTEAQNQSSKAQVKSQIEKIQMRIRALKDGVNL